MTVFHQEIEKLRNRPITIDNWAYFEIGRENDGLFKKNYQILDIHECGEEMANVDKYYISNKDCYYEKYRRYNKSNTRIVRKKVYLRESHARRLSTVDGYLRKRGLYLHVVSGWRHPELQRLIKNQYKKKFGNKKAEQLFASINRRVPAPHTTGAVFDVELRRLSNNKVIQMKIAFNQKKVNSLYWGEELLTKNFLSSQDEEALKNRRILYHVLCTSGLVLDKKELFTAHPGEYWHFGDGDTLSTYLNHQEVIKYGGIYL